jgi:hypothetical protein
MHKELQKERKLLKHAFLDVPILQSCRLLTSFHCAMTKTFLKMSELSPTEQMQLIFVPRVDNLAATGSCGTAALCDLDDFAPNQFSKICGKIQVHKFYF